MHEAFFLVTTVRISPLIHLLWKLYVIIINFVDSAFVFSTVSPTYLTETLCSGWLASTLIKNRDKYDPSGVVVLSQLTFVFK